MAFSLLGGRDSRPRGWRRASLRDAGRILFVRVAEL